MTPDSRLLLNLLKFADGDFVPTDATDWIGRVSESNAETVGESLVAAHRSTFLKGIAEGWGVEEFTSNLKSALGKETQKGGHEAEVITGMHTVFNRGRMDSFKEAGVKWFTFVAIVDERTTEVCNNLDGRILTPADGDEFNPPLHYRCRSLLSPNFKGPSGTDDARLMNDRDRAIARDEAGDGFLGKAKSIDPPVKRPELRRSDISEIRAETIRQKYFGTLNSIKGIGAPIASDVSAPLAFLDRAKPGDKAVDVQTQLVSNLRNSKADKPSKGILARLYDIFLSELFAKATLVSKQVETEEKQNQ